MDTLVRRITNTAAAMIGTLALQFALFSQPPVSAQNIYIQHNLVSDVPGLADVTDPNLVNPWGMAVSSGGTIWVSDNGTGVSTLYHQDGTAASLVVTIPTAARNKEGGNPTGVVFNGTTFFKVTLNGNSQPARFIFVSEDGSISGWSPVLDQMRLEWRRCGATDGGQLRLGRGLQGPGNQ